MPSFEDLMYAIAVRMRRKRFQFILKHINSFERPIKILDVGGTGAFWKEVGFTPSNGTTIMLLNVFEQTGMPPQFSSLVGDARDLSDFPEKAFDFVLSNAVINLMPMREDQVRMAREVQRVGRTYLVQSPNSQFPIDWRTSTPFFHYLLPDIQAWCFSYFRVGTYPQIKDRDTAIWIASRVHDLSVRDLSGLFAGAQLYKERWFGLTKSIAAYDFRDREQGKNAQYEVDGVGASEESMPTPGKIKNAVATKRL